MKYTICHAQEDQKYKSSAILGQEIVEGKVEDLQEALERLGKQGKRVQGWLEENGGQVTASKQSVAKH